VEARSSGLAPQIPDAGADAEAVDLEGVRSRAEATLTRRMTGRRMLIEFTVDQELAGPGDRHQMHDPASGSSSRGRHVSIASPGDGPARRRSRRTTDRRMRQHGP
jgi:hypothetical protein